MPVYLAMGSNQGDRRQCLAQALEALAGHGFTIGQVSPVYETPALLPPDAPAEWNIPYLNCVVEVETNLDPHECLAVTQSIETTLGRNRSAGRWSPRSIDIDILLYTPSHSLSSPSPPRGEGRAAPAGGEGASSLGNSKRPPHPHPNPLPGGERGPDLAIPHPGIKHRAFVLDPLSQLSPQMTLDGERILSLARKNKQHQPLIMGILNITDDSFSDGGLYTDPETLEKTLSAWCEAGIPIIDIGAESTRPGAITLSPQQEWERLSPCLDLLRDIKSVPLPPLLSLDTYHPETAEKAIAWGFDIINDVSGLQSPAMRALIRDSGVTAIAMHSLTVPADKSINLPVNCDPVATLQDWLKTRVAQWQDEGLNLDRIIFDPGFGFNKTAAQSLELLRHIDQFSDMPLRILAGHSRKSFMNIFSRRNYADRDAETLGLSLALIHKGVDILRVHNPLEHQRAMQAFLHAV